MLQAVFGLLLGGAMLAGLVRGQGAQVGAAMLAGAAEGVSSALSLAGGFALFCGLMAILRRAGAVEEAEKRESLAARRANSRRQASPEETSSCTFAPTTLPWLSTVMRTVTVPPPMQR